MVLMDWYKLLCYICAYNKFSGVNIAITWGIIKLLPLMFCLFVYFQGEWFSPWNFEIGYGAIIIGECFDWRWPRSKYQPWSKSWDWWGNVYSCCKLKNCLIRAHQRAWTLSIQLNAEKDWMVLSQQY